MSYIFYAAGLKEKRQNFKNEFLTSDTIKLKLESEINGADC
jgi:hypothetical protein